MCLHSGEHHQPECHHQRQKEASSSFVQKPDPERGKIRQGSVLQGDAAIEQKESLCNAMQQRHVHGGAATTYLLCSYGDPRSPIKMQSLGDRLSLFTT